MDDNIKSNEDLTADLHRQLAEVKSDAVLNKYDILKKISEKISEFAKEHNVAIVTATQPLDSSIEFMIDHKLKYNRNEVIFIDYLSYIRD